MTTEQEYLDAMSSGTIEILARNVEKHNTILKRMKAPTLRSCKYKRDVYEKSIAKHREYCEKFAVCILLVAKFYFQNVLSSNFSPNQTKRFSTTNLHGVFSKGLYLDDVKISHTHNGVKTTEIRKIKRPKHHNYSDEVNFITGQFLILVEKASLHNGPALWRFRELDLGDIILVELYELVKKYGDELNRMVMLFKDARFEDEMEVICEFIDWSDDENESVRDVNFVIDDVVRIWICGFSKY
jgi:hypothetical protein